MGNKGVNQERGGARSIIFDFSFRGVAGRGGATQYPNISDNFFLVTQAL